MRHTFMADLPTEPSHMSHLSVSTMGEPETDRLPAIDSPMFVLPPSPVKDKRNAFFVKGATKYVRDNRVVSKLSGTVNYTGYDAGTFVDRGQTIRPSALCVRCAVHASLCMTCSDLQTQEALKFYRKSIGKGASSILNDAIKQAGLGNTMKRAIFNMWRNSLSKQGAHLKALYSTVSVVSDRKYMRGPFDAWRKYTKLEIIEKKVRGGDAGDGGCEGGWSGVWPVCLECLCMAYLLACVSECSAAVTHTTPSPVILHIFPLHPLPLFSPNDILQSIL